MLKRKQSLTNDEWLETVRNIRQIVSRDETDQAICKAVAEIREKASGKRVAYAWSGGKDSIVLDLLCRTAGIKDCLFVHSNLEYPAFLAWCMEHMPEGCHTYNTGLDLNWLKNHPSMLFPKDSTHVYRWYRAVQQTGIRDYFRQHHLDMMIVGHRKADGNYTGVDGISTNHEGVTRYAPMADWPHELILATIAYYDLPIPPIYGWKNGYRNGTHAWPCRLNISTPEEGYREVWEIDPSIVREAAHVLDSAKTFLEGVGA